MLVNEDIKLDYSDVLIYTDEFLSRGEVDLERTTHSFGPITNVDGRANNFAC